MYRLTYLKYWRERLGISQQDFAEILNRRTKRKYNQVTMSLIESNSYNAPEWILNEILQVLRQEADNKGIIIPVSTKYWHLLQEIRLEEIL